MDRTDFLHAIQRFLGYLGRINRLLRQNERKPSQAGGLLGQSEDYEASRLSQQERGGSDPFRLYVELQRGIPKSYAKLIQGSDLLRNCRVLLVGQGEAIYQRYGDEIRAKLRVLRAMTFEALSLREGFEGAICVAFQNAVRLLIVLDNNQLTTWLLSTERLWWDLAALQIDALVDFYEENESKEICSLLLLSMQDFSTHFNSAAAVTALCMNLKSHDHTDIQDIGSEVLAIANALLQKPEIKVIYADQIRKTRGPSYFSDFEAAYDDARRRLLTKLRSVDQLCLYWSIHGVNLPTGPILIDEPAQKDPVLIQAYQSIVICHEFAHFLSRIDKATWGDYVDVATPTTQADIRLQVQVLELAEFYEELNREGPLQLHGEAGTQVVTQILGKVPQFLVLPGAREVLRYAQGSDALDEFKKAFTVANQQTEGLLESQMVSLQMLAGRTEGKDIVLFQGICLLTGQPWVPSKPQPPF